MRQRVILTIALVFAATECLLHADVEWDEHPSIRGIDTAKGLYEGWEDRLLGAFGRRELIEQGDNSRILWRRAMGPHGGYNDMAGPMGPAGLELTRVEDKIFVKGANFRLFWWTSRGGEICDIRQFDGNYWIPAVHHRITQTIGLVGTPHNEQIPVGFRSFRADTFPNFVVECPSDYAGNTPLYFLGEDKDAQFEVKQPSPDEVHLTATGRPATFLRQRCPLEIQQKYRIFQEGVVLCDVTMTMAVPKPAPSSSPIEIKAPRPSLTIRELGLGGTINDSLYADLYADCPSHFTSRMGKEGQIEHKRFFNIKRHMVLAECLPYFGVSYAFPGRTRRSYSNALDMILESRKGLSGDVVTKPFYSKFDPYSQQFFYSLAWGLYNTSEGKTFQIDPDFHYRNQYSLAFGSFRYGSSDSLPRAVQNQLALRRIVLWKNDGETGRAWYPTGDDIARLSRHGMDVLVLGRAWMAHPGVVNKTFGDYRPADEDALAGVIRACHAAGVRVGLSMLGQEYSILWSNEDWITKYLQRDYDGVLVEETNFLAEREDLYPRMVLGDDNKPTKVDRESAGAYADFLATRRLRKLVGDKGFLLGSSEIGPTAISLANFDAYVPSKERLSTATVDEFVDSTFLNGCGSVVAADVDARTAAHAAGLGCAFVRTVQARRDVDAPTTGAVAGLWKQYESFDRGQVTLYNGMTEHSGTIKVDSGLACLARNAQGKCILVVANPAAVRATCKVTIDAPRLKIKTNSKVVELNPSAVEALILE